MWSDSGHDQSPGAFHEGTQADIDGHAAPVASDSQQTRAVAHRPRYGDFAVPGAVVAVCVAISGGDEDLDVLAEQLATRVPEQRLGAPVREDDPPTVFDHHNAVRHRVQHRPRQRLSRLASHRHRRAVQSQVLRCAQRHVTLGFFFVAQRCALMLVLFRWVEVRVSSLRSAEFRRRSGDGGTRGARRRRRRALSHQPIPPGAGHPG